MSEYPADMRRILITLDIGGRERTRTVDTPADWPGLSDEGRRGWATSRCEEFVFEHVDVTWSDPDEKLDPYDWPTSWDGRTGDRVE